MHYGSESGLETGRFSQIVTTRDGITWAVAGAKLCWYDGWFWHRATAQDASEPITRILAVPSGGLYLLSGGRLYTGSRQQVAAIGAPFGDPRFTVLSVAHAGDSLMVVGRLTNGPLTLAMRSPEGDWREVAPPEPTEGVIELRLWDGRPDTLILSTSHGLFRWTSGAWQRLQTWRDQPARVRLLSESPSGDGMLLIEGDSKSSGLWEWSADSVPHHRPKGGDSTIAALGTGPGYRIQLFQSGQVRVRQADGPWSVALDLPASLQAARAIHVDPDGDLWFGATDGLGRYRISANRWTVLRQPEPSPLDRVNALLIRSPTDLWLGTEDGILVVKSGRGLRAERHIPRALGRRLGAITGLAEDGRGHVWVTSGSGFEGALRWDGGTWRHFGAADGLPNGPFHDIAVDRHGRPWLLSLSAPGSDTGAGAYMFDGERFVRWSSREGLTSDRVYAFAEGPDGARWFGTAGGLSRWKDGTWTHWSSRPALVGGTTQSQALRIATLAVDAAGRPWFGDTRTTHAFGLGTITERDEVEIIGAPAGPATAEVWDVAFDGERTVWASSPEGVGAFKDGIWYFMSPPSGLGASPWPVRSTDTAVFIGTTSGLHRLDRRAALAPPPHVVIDGAVADGPSVSATWRAVAHQGDVPAAAVETRYQWDDEPWSAWSTGRSTRATGVTHGPHTLRIQAKAFLSPPSGIAATVTVLVPAPIYRRPVVLVASGALVVGLVAAGLLSWRRHLGTRRERAVSEARLRTSEEKFSTLFRANPLPLIITTVDDGRITDANRAAQSMSGYDLPHIIGKTVFEVGASPSPDVRAGAIATVEGDGTALARELWFKAHSGRDLLLLTHANQIVIDGRPFILTAFTDITELRQLEERLLSAQRMEVVGQLAGGIAHEFNNLLTVMQGHADALADALPQAAGGLGRRVAAVRRSVMQAAQITAGLLTFARRTPMKVEPVDLNLVLSDLLPTIEGLIGRTIRLEVDLDSTPVVVEVDPAQIAQVLINLTLNAREAMPGGGVLTIAMRLAADRDVAHPRTDGRDWAEWTVTDTGAGMSEEVRRHMFEPFFTTKPPGRGTGLGLSICHGIVEQVGGHIDVTSTEGQGTTIRVYLPLTTARPAGLAAESPMAISLVSQGQSILVVEDEPDVRDIVTEILENAGYAVRACDSLAAVRALLESDNLRIDLLLTDLVLPGGSGIEVAATVSARHPSAPVLFMSGYSESVYSRQTEVTHLLPKPFTSPVLLRRVRELLEPDPP